MITWTEKRMKRVKQTVLAMAGAALISQTAGAADYSRLSKEIEIVKGILDTSLKQQTGREGVRYRSLDGTYLASQGVVFTVSTGNTSSGWIAQISSIVDRIPPIPEVPPAPVIVHSGDADFELSREWEVFADETAARVEEVFQQAEEQMYDLRSDERELAWEKRDIERRKRDLEFELSRTDDERGKEIKKELAEMEKEAEKLSQKAEKLQSRLSAVEQERAQKITERKEAQEKANRAFLTNFETGVGEALCSFGGGMRALPEDEHITFVLKGFVREGSQGKDRVYVFSKRAVSDCVKEKINAEKLLDQAKVYNF